MSFSPNSSTPRPGGACPSVGVQLEAVVLPPVLILDVALGLLGNVVALWIFCCKLSSWNPNSMFLFSLVVADFMALLSLPLRVHALLWGFWVFGDGMCRINLFLMFSNRSASIALMTVVAVYRYLKVLHPLHRCSRMSRRAAALLSVVVWLLVVSPRVPLLFFNHIKGSGNQTQCFFFTTYGKTSASILILVKMHRALTVLEFVFPFALLLFCCLRISCFLKRRTVGRPEKMRKAVRVCVAIIVVFLLCFLPTTVTTLGLWASRSFRPWDCTLFYTFTQLTIVSFGLNFLNSALDPIIYVFSSSVFRKALLSSLPCRSSAYSSTSTSSSGGPSTTQQELQTISGDGGQPQPGTGSSKQD
ncbi:hydroxycarboxylic acid receptor 2 [Gouania willdenowi]|uniref:Hydroxycarboxylic acid receptor 2-like n=1 Tax=Gouania willdenowi TaxID=441366 RepID=A0A8C5GT06_GOUWI|nr:hydroxycarboxylic acid receptor 2-like [Gouania willdenowi]